MDLCSPLASTAFDERKADCVDICYSAWWMPGMRKVRGSMLAPTPRRKYASLRIRNSDEVLQQILFQRQIWPRTDLHHKHCRYKHFVIALHSTFKRTIVTDSTISCCGTLFNATSTVQDVWHKIHGLHEAARPSSPKLLHKIQWYNPRCQPERRPHIRMEET